MIKMLINEEEVVSNKQFTINEEMLSTSSTILNNCYPKSWEDTKDYVNNFYYPLDYSKFKLEEGDFLHGNTQFSELNVNEINPSFETNVEKEFKSIGVDGKSYQATRDGKNLFNVNDGVVVSQYCSVDDDDWITASYDNSSGTSTIYLNYYTKKSEQLKASTNYAIFTEIKSVSGTGGINVTTSHQASQIKETTYYNLINLTAGQTKRNIVTTKDNFDNTYYMLRTFLAFPAGTSGSITFRISVLEDTSTTIDNFKYEKYGVSPSPDYPSEVECIDGKNLWQNSDYITNLTSGYVIKDGGFEFTRGSITGGKYIAKKIKVEKGKNYTFSATSNSFGTNYFYICIYRNNVYGQLVKSTIASYLNYNATENEELFFTFIIGSIITEVEASNIQLEVGSVVTDYVPYNAIQLKDVGKNLFDGIFELGIINGSTGQNGSSSNVDYIRNKNYISVKELTNYKFSSLDYIGTSVFVYEYKEDFSYNLTLNKTIPLSSYLTTNKDTKYIRFRPSIASTDTNIKFQLEEGTQATTYEPYQEKVLNINLQYNELCSLPNNIKDELVIENGRAKIIKRVGKAILNGSERWGQNVNQTKDNTSYYYTYALDNLAKKTSQLRSNYFINQETLNLDKEGISMSAAIPYLRLRINTSTASTPEKLLTWLSTHNTIVYYELSTPTEIDLGEVGNLSTFNGINNAFLNANMETNMNLVYYYKNYDLKFCGLVKNSGDISLNPRYPKYCSLQILDFKTLLSEGETLDFVINNKTIIQAIRMVISAISDYGFVEGNINIFNEDEEIGAYSTLNKTPYDVFQYLADISGSRWTTRLVDENTIAIDFYDTTLMPKGKNLEYTQNYWEDNKVVDLTFNFGTRDYRNKQIMLSDEVYADIDYTEEVITDGYATTFNLSSNIGTIYSISINGQEATFTTEINKKIGVIADFYYEVGKSKIESDDLLTSGKIIKVTYIPLVKGRQIVYNNDEVARVTNQIGRKGTISRYESRNDVLSSSELNSIGQTYIKYKGSAEIILNLKVEDNDIYNIGDVVYFDAPIQNLAQDYMVKRKSIDVIYVNDLQKIFYTYELTSSFNSERDINYFDNQRNKSTGNISEGDTIDRNIDIEDTANIIFYGLEINEIQVEGNNTLNSVLNSPFVN